jgi:hypothetical protein
LPERPERSQSRREERSFLPAGVADDAKYRRAAAIKKDRGGHDARQSELSERSRYSPLNRVIFWPDATSNSNTNPKKLLGT